ncbi:MAG: hypothetical protein QOE45_1053 [Frankiaceae bacterium]|nr:hypothetical protein [Frankiaceae bacterium]
MDTSDDQPPIEQDAEPGLAEETTFADEGVAPDGTGGPRGNLALGILAGIGAAVAGVLVWAGVTLSSGREFVGISVLTGLAVGYLMRRVSGRTGVGTRLGAALITAAACIAGTVMAVVAITSKTYKVGYVDLLRHFMYSETFTIVRKRPGLTLVVYAAAVVVAFLSAGPQKPKPSRAVAAPPEPVETVEPVEPAEPE